MKKSELAELKDIVKETVRATILGMAGYAMYQADNKTRIVKIRWKKRAPPDNTKTILDAVNEIERLREKMKC